MSRDLSNILANIPKLPGVYQYFDANKKLIYIGKSISLHSRVNSYFNGKSKLNFAKKKIAKLIAIYSSWGIAQKENNRYTRIGINAQNVYTIINVGSLLVAIKKNPNRETTNSVTTLSELKLFFNSFLKFVIFIIPSFWARNQD